MRHPRPPKLPKEQRAIRTAALARFRSEGFETEAVRNMAKVAVNNDNQLYWVVCDVEATAPSVDEVCERFGVRQNSRAIVIAQPRQQPFVVMSWDLWTQLLSSDLELGKRLKAEKDAARPLPILPDDFVNGYNKGRDVDGDR